tara:strand:+ start:161 stop:418 length:258 start_codon:yes stop_codon:yes gene_type:complete
MSDILDNFEKFTSDNSYNITINNGHQNYNKMKRQQLMFTDDLDNYIDRQELLNQEKTDFETINKRSITVNIIFIVMFILFIIIFL